VQSFVFLGLLVFELEPMYAKSDRRTDGRTTDADDRLMPPPPLRGRGHNKRICVCVCVCDVNRSVHDAEFFGLILIHANYMAFRRAKSINVLPHGFIELQNGTNRQLARWISQ